MDATQCYAAVVAHDVRFDGVFFVGVTSTGVYCRPICRVRTPRPDRCRYFPHAALAEAAGFRPCLRCRPEQAPGLAPIDRPAESAQRAVQRIQAGALQQQSAEVLAAELGISSRQLRRVLERHLGVGPSALAQTQRLLLAKQLLADTTLPMAEIAFASGFGSVRRFNALFLQRYRLNPSDLRRSTAAAHTVQAQDAITLQLGYRPPLAWAELSRFLASRGATNVESCVGSIWRRSVRHGPKVGWIEVQPAARAGHLAVTISHELIPVLMPLLARLRQWLDLDASPAVIDAQLSRDPQLAPLVQARPGLRVPGCACGFELAARAVLGQQVSVAAASTLFQRWVDAFGEPIRTPFPELSRLTPTAEAVAEAPLERIRALGLPLRRAECLHGLASAVASGALDLSAAADPGRTLLQLQSLPGIGPWTTQYIAMRALRQSDAFPDSDLGLRRFFGADSPVAIRARAEQWRPWRAYAALHIWTAAHSGGG